MSTIRQSYREPAGGYDKAPPVASPSIDPVRLHFAEVKRAVEVSAASYIRKLWWMSKEEIEQQAWMYALEIMRQGTYDPAVGVPLFSYLRRGISRLLYNFVCAESAPVSAPRRNAGRLKGLLRADVEEAPEEIGDLAAEHREAMQAVWRRTRIESLLAKSVGSKATEQALPYLLREESNYQRAAARAGTSVEEVKAAVREVRRTIARSPECWALWAEAA